MDERRFDRWTYDLTAARSRRRILATLSAAVLALCGVEPMASAAKNKKKRGKGKQGNNKKQGDRKKKRGRQCGGAGNACPECQKCVNGRCVVDPGQDGTLCVLTCFRCQAGRCAVPDDEVCPGAELCHPETGACCTHCQGGGCCPAGTSCINPPAGERYCCDGARQLPCSANGDGTYADCCDPASEQCCPALNTCIPKDQCCPGDPSCCPTGQSLCNGSCCAGECCGGRLCINPGASCCGPENQTGWCPDTMTCCETGTRPGNEWTCCESSNACGVSPNGTAICV